MKERTKESPVDRGVAEAEGRCQVCGAEGKTIMVPNAPPPNEFCARCAIEYGESAAVDEDELAP